MSKAARRSLPVADSHPVAAIRRVVGRVVIAVGFVVPAALGAQAWAYPSFQPPRVMNREFNFGVADAGDAGTSLIFQWREGLSTSQPARARCRIRRSRRKGERQAGAGGPVRLPVHAGNAEMPLDFLGHGGRWLRVRRRRQPGAHPVRGLDRSSLPARPRVRDHSVHSPTRVDRHLQRLRRRQRQRNRSRHRLRHLGANFEVTKQLSFRVSVLFGGSDTFGDSDGFGLSLAWSPPQLSKLIR